MTIIIYYPVILRAVAALETNTFEARRAIYNRVRAVQSYQLGQRPFNKADFDRERSTLEDAISRVEIEATNKHGATETPGAAVGPSDIVATSDTPLRPAHEGETLLARGIRKCLSIIRRSNPA